jgi:integrase
MHNLKFDMKNMWRRMKGGAFATRDTKLHLFYVIADALVAIGFRNLRLRGLKPKHVEALVDYFKDEEYAVGSIKNLMTCVRQWAEYIGKENVVKPTNREYGIDDRIYVTNLSKAKILPPEQFARLTDEYTKASIRLAIELGLRREECIKIQPEWADMGDRLRLKDSWTKGGKYREIPITTADQRAAIKAAKVVANGKSLIPPTMRYVDQLNRFKAQCQKAGIRGVHGLRHQYAQARYEELSGWKCPAQGGPTSKQLTPDQKARDREVRLHISQCLGHEREQITSVYLGR